MPAFAFDLVRVYRVEIASGVVLYALAELLWLRLRRGRTHEPRELLANVFIYVIDTKCCCVWCSAACCSRWSRWLGAFAVAIAPR